MHKEELINTLENIKLPDIKTPVHKGHLENTLLKTKQSDKNEGIFNVMNSAVNDALNNTRYMFTSKQPAFRISIVAVLLTVALGLGIQAANAPAPELTEDQIIEILQNDSEFMSLFAEEIGEIHFSNGTKETHVRFSSLSGYYPFASVDIDRKSMEVTDYSILRRDNFSDEEQANISELLNNNSETKALLEMGAEVVIIETRYDSRLMYPSKLPQPSTAFSILRLVFDESKVFHINGIDIKESSLSVYIDLVHADILVQYLDSFDYDELTQLINLLKTDERISSLAEAGILIYDSDSFEDIAIDLGGVIYMPYFQIGEGFMTTTVDIKPTSPHATVLEKLITLYIQSGEKYYKVEIDFLNSTILSVDEITIP
jgi:hypothetical protein